MMRRMREWTFLVSGPDGGFSWLWTRLCEVLASPSRVGVWLWPGLMIAGLLIAAGIWAIGRRRPEPSPGGIPQTVLFAAVTLAVGVASYAGFLRVLNYWTQPWYYITLAAFSACLLEVLFGAWPATSKSRITLRSVRLAVALLMKDLRTHRVDLAKQQMTTAHPIAPVLRRMAEVLHAGHTVWLIGGLNYVPPGRQPLSIPPGSAGNYYAAWSEQASFFVQTHSRTLAPLPIACDQPVVRYEDLPLTAIRGWRSESGHLQLLKASTTPLSDPISPSLH